MSREQAKEQLIKLGIEEPTDEQISGYLNTVNGEVNKEKAKTSKYEDELSALRDSAKELEALKKQNMSDIELANNERDKAINDMKTLQAEVQRMKLKTSFAEQGIVGEDADKLIDSIKDGSIDVALLGQIITAKKEEAVNQKVAELSEQTIQPNMGSIDKETKTDADKMIDDISNSLKSENTQSIIDAYK